MKYLSLLLVFVSNYALAQTAEDAKVFASEEAAVEAGERSSGHNFKAMSGANLIENSNVVGQDDGTTRIYSLQLNYAALRLWDDAEWDSKIDLTETLSQTPAISRYVKTDDEFKAQTTYKKYFHSVSWLGGFARAELQAPLMDGYNNQASPVTYAIARRNGNVDTVTDDRLKLNDGLKPLVTKESLGAIAKILAKEYALLELRTGLGAKQIAADGQLLIKDDEATTGVIEVVELQNVTLTGIELGLEFSGKWAALQYKLYAEALMPVSYSPKNDNDPAAQELTSTEAGVDLSYAVESWLALTYKLKSKRDPLLLDKAQITQNFLLALTYAFDSRGSKE